METCINKEQLKKIRECACHRIMMHSFVPSVLDKTLFGNITVPGKKQMTYKGWPLYHFGQDSVRESNLAVSVPVAGKWPVAVKDIQDPKK